MKKVFSFFMMMMVAGQLSFAQEAQVKDLSEDLQSIVYETYANNEQIQQVVKMLLLQAKNEVDPAAVETVIAKLQSPEIAQKIAKPYIDNFSDDEIAQLAAFYRTQAAKKVTSHAQEMAMNLIEVIQEVISDVTSDNEEGKELTKAMSWNSKIVNLNSGNYASEVENSDLPVVIDVYATWCGPCKTMAPRFNNMCNKYNESIKFAKFDIDSDRSLASKLGVSSLPTFLFMKDGKVVHKHIGSMSESQLESKLKKHLR